MRIIAVLVLLAGAVSAGPFVDPATGAMRIFDVPVGADYGLVMVTDTLHVTTDEKKWVLTGGAVSFPIVNPTANTLLWRINVTDIQQYLGAYGSDTIEAPGMVSTAFDSLCVDGSAACTIYLRWWKAV